MTRTARPVAKMLTVLVFANVMGSQALAAKPGTEPTKPQTSANHWAFHPPRLPTVPRMKNQTWVRTPVDAFVLARLDEKGLIPSKEADPTVLIRRLSLDLLGLPPTAAEIDAFVRDDSPDAYERLVDRLLNSPQYGVRAARFWLDLARFGESHGFEYDKMREHAWPYRDYVIRSFNSDKSYRQFIKEQLAGDVLEPVTRDGIIATTFLVAGPWDEVGNNQVSQLMKARVREEELEDILAAVGQTFLGITINCARCHAHKFDPIPQSDYYRVKAVFEGVRYGDRPILTPSELQTRRDELAGLERKIRSLESKIAGLESAARLAVAQRRRTQTNSSGVGSLPNVQAPVPYAYWSFEADAKDQAGKLAGELIGGASVANGRLILDGKKAYVRSDPLTREIREKTFEVSLQLSTLNQRGGGAISLEDGNEFDAIVFGERQPKKWIAGSAFFRRTLDLMAPEETSTNLIQMVTVYNADNSVAIYRNGVAYANRYTPKGDDTALQPFSAGRARVLIGLRHTGAANGHFAGEIEEAKLYDRALTADEVTAAYRKSPASITEAEIVESLNDQQRQERVALLDELRREQAKLQTIPPVPLAYAGTRQQPGPTHRLVRGDVESKAEVMAAGALSTLGASEFGLQPDAPESERRRKFAEWVASPENPLTARVIVNRIWQQHFGTGLVTTPSDFGLIGERPSHPELLDWLAVQLMNDEWSIKRLHKLILTSNTYRQSSQFNSSAAAVDADNRLLWHFAPRRIEGEAIRDLILSVSGQLNGQMDGPSFRPFTTSAFGGSIFYTLTDPETPQFNRRTIYRMNINSGKNPLLDAFDCPDPSVKIPWRRTTTTPLQALGLMNNEFVQRQARHFAQRVAQHSGPNLLAQINHAYQLAFGREPTDTEAAEAAELAREQGLENVCWVLLNASEFLYLR